MNIIKKINLIFVILILITGNIFPDENISIFQENAIRYNSDYFHEDDKFIILGNIEINRKKIILANNIYIWGSSQRATWRFLLFLDDGTFLGMYNGIIFSPVEIKIIGQKIIFPMCEEYGNTIDFSKGIPDEIWVDGYIYSYIKINEIK